MTTRTEQADATDETKASGSLLTVLIALAANALIATAKSVVAAFTGSASMVAEAAHSWADAGNEIFLLVAERRAVKPADKAHPFGYGREAYVWSMFAAFGLFTAGAVVSVLHGVQSFLDPEQGEADYGWAYAVLGIAFVLEGFLFLQARRQTRADASKLGMRPLRFLNTSSNPTLRAVFVEDAVALTGLVIAGLGIALHQITGDARYDAVGSILVGILLGVVAFYLIGRNRDFLVGQTVQPELRAKALAELRTIPAIERVTFLHMEYVGPARVFLVAAVDLTGDDREEDVARRLRELERQLESNERIQLAILTLSVPDEPTI